MTTLSQPRPVKALIDGALRHNSSPVSAAAERPAQRVTLGQLDAAHHPKVASAIRAARAWASEKIAGRENISLVLVATPVVRPDGTVDPIRTGYGCGKTHIARAVQWASYTMLEDGTPVAPCGRFFTATVLLALLGDDNRMSELVPAGTETIYGRVGGTPVLILDDVGAEGNLRFVAQQVQAEEIRARYFLVINYCYERKISVVITANKSLPALKAHLGGRAWSRLMEMAPAGFMLDLTGVPDYRRQQGGR